MAVVMALRTFPPGTPLAVLQVWVGHTWGALVSDPLTQSFAPPFKAMFTECQALRNQQEALELEVERAEGAMVYTDRPIDGLLKKVEKLLLVEVGHDHKAREYVYVFQKRPLNKITRPVHGAELEFAAGAVGRIKELPFAPVSALAPELEKLVAAGQKTVADHKAAKAALDSFLTVGPAQQFTDKVNAQSHLTHGELGEMAHQSGSGLPKSFADSFFLHEHKEGVDAPTVESLTAKIADLTKQLAAAQAELAELNAEAAQKVAEEQRQAELEKEISQGQQAIDGKQKELDELQSRKSKSKKKK